MTARLSTDALEAFLAEPHVADLVTLREDGSPHVAPVWYAYEGGRFLVFTGTSAVKVRNIRNDPRVAVSVATDDGPYRYVLLEGMATLIDRDLEGVTERICVRYRGPDRGMAYARELLAAGGNVVIEVVPERVRSWADDE